MFPVESVTKLGQMAAKTTNPLSFLDMVFVAAPSVIGGLAQLFGGKPKPTAYQRELGRLSSMLKEQYDLADSDALSTNSAKARLKLIKEQSDEAEKRLGNVAGRMGMTDEAKLSGINNINQNTARGTADIIANNENEKSRILNQYINIAGMNEQMRMNQLAERSNRISGIVNPLSNATGSYFMSKLWGK